MKLILCCDYGLDDAAATFDVLSHADKDGWDEVYLVAVGGNVPSEISRRNAKKLVANLFPQGRVTIVDTTAYEQPSEYLKTIHGDDGMGDLFEDKPFKGRVLSFDEFLSSLTGEYALLSLGPMTLVPAILQCGKCKQFVFMGGNIQEEPNFHGYEFNHALERDAFARAVIFPHVAITMDTCRNPRLNIQEAQIEGESWAHKIADRARSLTFTSGEKGCYIWDDIAVKYLRHPDWFSLYTARDRDGNLLTVARYENPKTYLEIIEA